MHIVTILLTAQETLHFYPVIKYCKILIFGSSLILAKFTVMAKSAKI